MTALHQVVLQGIEKSSQNVHLDVKIYWKPFAIPLISTTVTTLLNTIVCSKVDKFKQHCYFNPFWHTVVHNVLLSGDWPAIDRHLVKCWSVESPISIKFVEPNWSHEELSPTNNNSFIFSDNIHFHGGKHQLGKNKQERLRYDLPASTWF